MLVNWEFWTVLYLACADLAFTTNKLVKRVIKSHYKDPWLYINTINMNILNKMSSITYKNLFLF